MCSNADPARPRARGATIDAIQKELAGFDLNGQLPND
jgi:hypothetical protein